MFLYADEVALLTSLKDNISVRDMLSSEEENIAVWISDNKLSLHLKKTEAILFGFTGLPVLPVLSNYQTCTIKYQLVSVHVIFVKKVIVHVGTNDTSRQQGFYWTF